MPVVDHLAIRNHSVVNEDHWNLLGQWRVISGSRTITISGVEFKLCVEISNITKAKRYTLKVMITASQALQWEERFFPVYGISKVSLAHFHNDQMWHIPMEEVLNSALVFDSLVPGSVFFFSLRAISRVFFSTNVFLNWFNLFNAMFRQLSIPCLSLPHFV